MDGAGDGRASGGDGAQEGAHDIGREGADHGYSVGDPGCGVSGPDGLTPGQCEAAMWTRVPAPWLQSGWQPQSVHSLA